MVFAKHPITRRPMHALPILPIGFRTGGRGRPTPLGEKYEAVLRAAWATPPGDDPLAWLDARRPVSDLLASLFGVPFGEAGHGRGSDTVLGLLVGAVTTMSPDVDLMTRAAGLALEVGAVL